MQYRQKPVNNHHVQKTPSLFRRSVMPVMMMLMTVVYQEENKTHNAAFIFIHSYVFAYLHVFLPGIYYVPRSKDIISLSITKLTALLNILLFTFCEDELYECFSRLKSSHIILTGEKDRSSE